MAPFHCPGFKKYAPTFFFFFLLETLSILKREVTFYQVYAFWCPHDNLPNLAQVKSLKKIKAKIHSVEI